MFFFAYPVSQRTQIGEGAFFEQSHTIIKRDSFFVQYFLADLLELGIFDTGNDYGDCGAHIHLFRVQN